VLSFVRVIAALAGIAGGVHLLRRLPPVISARRDNRARRANAARYEAWRGGPERSPDLLDATEAEILDARLRRLVVLACAAVAGCALALFAPGN
jgi:hypothetical protein